MDVLTANPEEQGLKHRTAGSWLDPPSIYNNWPPFDQCMDPCMVANIILATPT